MPFRFARVQSDKFRSSMTRARGNEYSKRTFVPCRFAVNSIRSAARPLRGLVASRRWATPSTPDGLPTTRHAVRGPSKLSEWLAASNRESGGCTPLTGTSRIAAPTRSSVRRFDFARFTTVDSLPSLEALNALAVQLVYPTLWIGTPPKLSGRKGQGQTSSRKESLASRVVEMQHHHQWGARM